MKDVDVTVALRVGCVRFVGDVHHMALELTDGQARQAVADLQYCERDTGLAMSPPTRAAVVAQLQALRGAVEAFGAYLTAAVAELTAPPAK